MDLHSKRRFLAGFILGPGGCHGNTEVRAVWKNHRLPSQSIGSMGVAAGSEGHYATELGLIGEGHFSFVIRGPHNAARHGLLARNRMDDDELVWRGIRRR
jgi:hypothetical protein